MVKGLIVLLVAAVAFIVYALVDCAFTERQRMRSLTKPIWALLIVVLPVIGAVLWLLLGKAGRADSPRLIAPDDDPDFLGRAAAPVSDRERESLDERIRKLEEELAERDDDGPGKPTR
ncbi:PLD nuclease N-terminal domain-containing protein [Frondihabitans sp. VKM Ac-2883]|uniref:PLD nuclease N-terminal domain-containing protein n=1 Tax=Frondihabitans sp. VKM Ac-2883 TaxID=2783823 RepID=UPI00188D7F0C|nr:PLD nuclease N-terminal domain-containing protein [Frondihabitans sp. VKM Ac-2883]MBF4576031.1 PLDc_N domain-containing protein [Frondihabitans sp. VKM Ac-2883]